MLRVVGGSRNVSIPILAHRFLKGFFECASDLEQLPRYFPSFRRALGIEKFTDRLLKLPKRGAVFLLTHQIGALHETKLGRGFRHRRFS